MVKIEFKYPDVINTDEFLLFDSGCYDTGEKVVYIFHYRGFQHLIETLIHETLHAIIHKVAGEEITIKYDAICTSVEQVNRKV